MLLSVIAEYRESPIVKVLTIQEETGELGLVFLDTSDAEQLSQVKKELDSGVTYADFQVYESKTEDGMVAYELRHYCTNIAPGEPDFASAGSLMLDELSVMGMLRLMVTEGGRIVLPLKDVPEDNIPDWMIVNPNTVQFTSDFGAKFSHLVPSETEGYWKWNSSYIFAQFLEGGFDDFTRIKFLVPEDFDGGDFEEIMTPYTPCTVVYEDGKTTTFKSFHINSREVPVYPSKSSFLMRTQTISRIKFAADSYKLALHTLTEGLFVQKKIEKTDYGYEYGSGGVDARNVKLTSKPALSKKTADTMMQFMASRMTGEATESDERMFLKNYPHYQAYKSIIDPHIDTFFLEGISVQQKMRAYTSLKNVEATLNILLQECKYHMMFSNDSFYFNMFSQFNAFITDIPNYNIQISGGGHGWRPKDTTY